MNNEIQIFSSSEFGRIRTITIDNEPWFVEKDVAEALGYKNTKDALQKHVDEEDKQIFQRSQIVTLENHIPKDVLPVEFVSSDIPNRGLTFINESGVYSLIFGSKLPTAKKFKHWVTSEVLPTLRKTGHYEIQKDGKHYQPTRPLTSDDYIDAARTIAKCHNSRLQIVFDLYRKAGLDISRVQTQKNVQDEANAMELVELLNQHTLTELCNMLDICKTSLYYYRIGKHKPNKERMKKIIKTLRERVGEVK